MSSSTHDMPAPQEQFSQSSEEMTSMIEKLRSNDFPVERLQSMTRSVDARRDLLDDFKRITGTNGDAEKVMEELGLFSSESARAERFLENAQSPEKRGVFRRGFDGIKSFAKKHPVVFAALVAALIAGGVGGALYLSGSLQFAQAGVAVETLKKFIEGTDFLNSGIGGMEGFHSMDGLPPGV